MGCINVIMGKGGSWHQNTYFDLVLHHTYNNQRFFGRIYIGMYSDTNATILIKIWALQHLFLLEFEGTNTISLFFGDVPFA